MASSSGTSPSSIFNWAGRCHKSLHECASSTRWPSIEALREVFAGSEAEDDLARNLDTQELDESMREIGEVEGPVDLERVPAGVPESHWWWRYPAS